ncbi:hypothetical protein ACHAWF_011622 [Thalassiosira exigua]
MGSRRFGAFIVYSSVLSTILELIFFNVFFIERYSGPYPQLGAVLALYHRYTPRLHPKFFGVLGCDFSEKSLTYGLCAQVVLSGGLSTLVPAAIGFLSGMLTVGWSASGLPEFVNSLCQFVGKPFVDEAPAIMMTRSVQRGADRGNRVRRAPYPNAGAAAAPAAPRPPPPPPEEAIAQLTGMGFDRQAVIRALQQTDNNYFVQSWVIIMDRRTFQADSYTYLDWER